MIYLTLGVFLFWAAAIFLTWFFDPMRGVKMWGSGPY